MPSAGLPFVLTQKEAKSQEAPKSCPADHSAVSARARNASASENPSFSLLELPTFRLGYGAFRKYKASFLLKCLAPTKLNTAY